MVTARRFRLRISRLLQSCRCNDATSLPSDRVPSFRLRLPPLLNLPMDGDDHRRSFLNDHEPSSLISYGCGCGCGSRSSCVSIRRAARRQEFQWKQEAGFHVVVAAATSATAPRRKVYSSSASDCCENALAPPPLERRKRRPRNRNRNTTSFRQRISSSSGDSGLFSGEEIAEAAAQMLLVSSSRGYSTDSSSDSTRKETEALERKKAPKKKKNRSRRSNAKSRRSFSLDPHTVISSPARLSSVFRKLAPPCALMEGPPAAKVRESFAVVKRSDCPYDDFKGSMMEMIVEKEMFEEEDLQELLLCFLSLNSSRHHGAIVAAFSEIWEALFDSQRSYHVDRISTGSPMKYVYTKGK